jgi:hypothetical protein
MTISLPDGLVDEAQRVLIDTGQVPSFSAAVAEALDARLAASRRAKARLRAELDRIAEDDPERYAEARSQADALRHELRGLAAEYHRPAAS